MERCAGELVIVHPVNEAPINEHPSNKPQEEQAAKELYYDPTMAALAKHFPIFVGKKSEDAEFHVNRFEYYWKVAQSKDPNLAAQAMEELKKDAFMNTFTKGAT